VNNNKTIIIVIVGLFLASVWFLIPKKKEARGTNAIKVTRTVEVPSDTPKVSGQELYEKATELIKDRELAQAKIVYQKILSQHSDFEDIEKVQKELEDLNMEIIFSNALVDNAVVHQVVSGDTLGKLAKKYGTTIELIKMNNNLKNNIIRLDKKLRIWTGQFNIVVDKSRNQLLLKEGDNVIKVYNVSTGKGNSTPLGNFIIKTKLIDPVWFNRGVVVPPESPQNVLGSRWLGFDSPGYGIHGTIEPETIGKQMTAGCVRMLNEQVEELYNIIPLGTKVLIID